MHTSPRCALQIDLQVFSTPSPLSLTLNHSPIKYHEIFLRTRLILSFQNALISIFFLINRSSSIKNSKAGTPKLNFHLPCGLSNSRDEGCDTCQGKVRATFVNPSSGCNRLATAFFFIFSFFFCLLVFYFFSSSFLPGPPRLDFLSWGCGVNAITLRAAQYLMSSSQS